MVKRMWQKGRTLSVVSFIMFYTGIAWCTNEPLAVLDFSTGEAQNVKIVGEVPSLVKVDGHTVGEFSTGRISLPMVWPAEMPNPGFPAAGNLSPKTRPTNVANLVLDIDQKRLHLEGPQDLAFVITVYDMCEGNAGSSIVIVSWSTADKKSGSGEFCLSGDPYVTDPLYRPRLLRKTVIAPGIVLNKEGRHIEIQTKIRLFIKRIEIYKLPPSRLDNFSSRREAGLIGRHGAPVSILDLWRKDFSDLMVEQTRAYACWVDADDLTRELIRHANWVTKNIIAIKALDEERRNLQELVEKALIEMDAFFYEGKVALIREDFSSYKKLMERVRETLNAIHESARKLQEKVDAANRKLDNLLSKEGLVPHAVNSLLLFEKPQGIRPSPLDRILFAAFSNSPWDCWDPFNVYGRVLPFFGIRAKGYLLGGPSLEEDGSLDRGGEFAYRENAIMKERARGFDVAIGVGHHWKHLAVPEFPGWLHKKSKDSLYDINYKGEVMTGNMDIWNPYVREYFQNVCTAYAKATVQNPHVIPWFYWTEILCGTGYSPCARKAFTEYLKEKYSDITKLNKLWGSEYTSFDDIQAPPPPGEVLRTKATGLTYEFEKFRRDSFVEWFRGAKEALRKGHPEARLWLEGWGRYDYLLRHGMDQLSLFEIADISSVHTNSAEDAQRLWQLALSRYSDTPIADGEIVINGSYYKGFTSMEQLRAAAEQHVLMQCWYGVRLFLFWTCQFNMNRVYSYGGPFLYDRSEISPMSSSAFAIRTVRKKADLYDNIIKNTKVVPSQVGILYSSTSFINSWPYNEVEHETYPIHSWLYHSDFGYWMVHEDAICDGREDLQSFRVIIAPWAAWLQPEAAEKLLNWVKLGGVLISSGPIGAFDQYGKPLNTILDPALGKVEVDYIAHERTGDTRFSDESREYLGSLGDENTTHFGGWVWLIKGFENRPEGKVLLKLADGTPVIYEARLGYGKVIVSTGPIGKNGLRRLVMNEIEHRAIPLVRKTRDDGLHVLLRTDTYENLYLGVFNLNVNEHVTDTLLIDGHYQNVIDKCLSGDWPVPTKIIGDRTAITLRLAPGEGTVLLLGSMFSANRKPVDRQSIVTPELPLVSCSHQDILKAKAKIGKKKLSSLAKAEALALILAAQRYCSLGYYERAQRLMNQALETKNPGKFVGFPEDDVKAFYSEKPVAVDGNASEWRNIPRYSVKNTPSAGGEFAFQWDEENLYILTVVQDTNLKEIEEQGADYNWIWGYDGILLNLNPANTSPLTVGGALYDAKYRASQTLLMVSITGRKYANSPSGFSAAPVRSAVKTVKGGYIMEVAIPLRDVMIPAVAGANIGFEFNILNNGEKMGFARFSDRETWEHYLLHFARLELVKNLK